ncbi:MAG: hypothetical protein AB7K36_24200, partial [Chloroflexota bacterium]
VFGPFTSLEPGSYLARFHVAASGNDPLARAATLDVMTDLPELFTVLARRELRLGDLPSGGGYATIELAFTLRERARVETRIRYHGETEFWLGSIDVLQTAPRETLELMFPSWPRALLWVAATLFVGALLLPAVRQVNAGDVTVRVTRRTDRDAPPILHR